MLNHYSILDIKSNATEAEISAAFFAKAKQYHPDKAQMLSKKLEKQGRTAKEIEVITEINNKKYNALKMSYTELMENREEYDNLLQNKTDYSILKSDEEIIIEKTELVSNFDENIFNEIFVEKNKKEVVMTEKTTCNVNKAYAELLAERDNIDCEYIKPDNFDVIMFNNNFFNTDIYSETFATNNSSITEYEESSIYNFKNSLAEISHDGIIDTINNNADIKELYKPAEKIICNRQIIDIKNLPEGAFVYNHIL